jgi:hypothetical protein
MKYIKNHSSIFSPYFVPLLTFLSDGHLTDCFVLPCRSFLFSAGILYEVDKLSGMILARSESKARRY